MTQFSMTDTTLTTPAAFAVEPHQRVIDQRKGESMTGAQAGDIVLSDSGVYRLYDDGQRLRGWLVAEWHEHDVAVVPVAELEVA